MSAKFIQIIGTEVIGGGREGGHETHLPNSLLLFALNMAYCGEKNKISGDQQFTIVALK